MHFIDKINIHTILFCIFSMLTPLCSFYEVYPSYIISTFIIIGLFFYLFRISSIFSFELITYVIIFIPALAPAYAWNLMGEKYISWAARHLQTNRLLVDKTLFLFAIAAIFYVLAVGIYQFKKTNHSITGLSVRQGILSKQIVPIIASIVLIAAYILESGPTFIHANYANILSGRLSNTPIIVFVATSFGGLWALLFVFGRRPKIIFWGCTAITISWLALHIRRVELFGIVTVLFLWGSYRINKKILILLFVVFLGAQAVLGLIRTQSFVDFIGSDTRQPYIGYQNVAAIPGGVSNIFLSGLHLVNEKDKGFLTFEQQFTLPEWLRSVLPNQIWHLIGLPSVKTEHDLIYNRLGLEYVGGMPLLTAFYLNGGYFLVIFFGIFHGWLAKRIGSYLDIAFRYNSATFSTKKLYFIVIFIIYQFRYQWYNPQTMFRALFFSLVSFAFFQIFINWHTSNSNFIKDPDHIYR